MTNGSSGAATSRPSRSLSSLRDETITHPSRPRRRSPSSKRPEPQPVLTDELRAELLHHLPGLDSHRGLERHRRGGTAFDAREPSIDDRPRLVATHPLPPYAPPASYVMVRGARLPCQRRWAGALHRGDRILNLRPPGPQPD